MQFHRLHVVPSRAAMSVRGGGARLGRRRFAVHLLWLLLPLLLTPSWVSAQVELPVGALEQPIVVTAARCSRWQEGQYEVWLLRGGCRIRQEDVTARSRDGVLWIDYGDPQEGIPTKVIAYLESDVVVLEESSPGGDEAPQWEIKDRQWLGRLHTHDVVKLEIPRTEAPPPGLPPLVARGREARAWEKTQRDAGAVEQAQFQSQPWAPSNPAGPSTTGPLRAETVVVEPRSSAGYDFESVPSADNREQITAFSGGVRVTVGGIENAPGIQTGTLVIEAERVIVWTDALSGAAPGMGAQAIEGSWEFYLEGDVTFREGDRVIYADRMYYDVTRRQGMILNAEALTPIPEYEGLVRLKADVIHQLDRQNLLAYGAAITSSRLGVPRYWLQAGNIALQDIPQPRLDPFTGQPAIDPRNGMPDIGHQLLATSRNNFLYVAGLPVFYWPVLATDLLKPSYFVDRVKFGNDSVFGTQALIDWDVFQLLGLSKDVLPGTDWTISTDWLSERGFGLGTNLRYDDADSFGSRGLRRGEFDAWGLKDNGADNLGLDRRMLIPEEEFRGRVRWQHRQHFPNGLRLSGELGLISDRNFLEQFFETEWDEWKDQTTNLELRQNLGNSTWSVFGQARLNDFYTQTEWLPRLDHFVIGQSLLHDWLTWHSHSHVGYARLRVAEPPAAGSSRQSKFDTLAWEQERDGLHAATRQEIDLPFFVGPVKVVPYALGELFQVGEDFNGNQRGRAYGQLGARTSISLWRGDHSVQSSLLNLNGLAHKVELESDFFWSDASENLQQFPLYEELDDDSVEFFRRRFFFDTFNGMAGGNVPLRFDERFFAFRSAMQSHVTSPSTVIADDLSLFKMGLRQRWQTRRGPPGQQRIIDWVVFDVEASYFPESSRDNFGQQFGLVDYDFRWHVGDRLTFLSDGFVDFFADGLRTFSAGGLIRRPERGQAYVGFRTIEGPISSNILTGSVSYRMTDKWILSGGTSVDLGATGNIGQFLSLTRIGESALVRIGFNVDSSRDSVGVNFSIEPRFLASNRMGRVGGVQIAPAGAYGLE